MALYNRPKSYALPRPVNRRADSIFRAGQSRGCRLSGGRSIPDGESIKQQTETFSSQIPSLQKVLDATNAAVEEGTQLPLEQKRAQVNLAASQERLGSAQLDEDYYQMLLAVTLGFPATDRVQPVDSDLAHARRRPLRIRPRMSLFEITAICGACNRTF